MTTLEATTMAMELSEPEALFGEAQLAAVAFLAIPVCGTAVSSSARLAG